MSNRRKPRPPRVTRPERPAGATTDRRVLLPPAVSDPRLDGMEPWLWAMLDADEAEENGDVAAALQAVRRRLLDPQGKPFWRLSRVVGLEQLATLGSATPGWAVSRWICALALRHLDHRDRGPTSRSARALRAAIDLRGGPEALEALTGCDAADRQAGVVDHDWVYRQLHLYELGGLAAYLNGPVSGEVVARADHVRGWTSAPMGGFCFLGPQGQTLRWLDLAAQQELTTPDIGTAAKLQVGDHVLGRLVPVAGGVMFDGCVLAVPRPVAVDVAANRTSWLEVLQGVRGQIVSGELTTVVPGEHGLLSDIALEASDVLLSWDQGRHPPVERPDHAPAPAALRWARMALEIERVRDAYADLGARTDLSAHLPPLEEAVLRLAERWDGLGGWAQLHAALLTPAVAAGLAEVVSDADLALLDQVSHRVAEPASSWVAQVVERRRGAA